MHQPSGDMKCAQSAPNDFTLRRVHFMHRAHGKDNGAYNAPYDM